MQIKTLFFASSRDIVGQRELRLDVAEGTTVALLLDRLVSDYPGLAGHVPTMMVAVNSEYVRREQALHSGDEVAIIPPVSGGSHGVV